MNEEVLGRVVDYCKEVRGLGMWSMLLRFSPDLPPFNVAPLELFIKLFPEITHVSVPSGCRRRSIGSLLVKRLFKTAEETKLLIYFSSELAAHDFFLAQGFKDDKSVGTDLSKSAGPYLIRDLRYSGFME
jgi:hypothetical protein